MESHLSQAFSDFEEYLSGSRAPALVAHSLAKVVAQDQRTVAAAVVRWVDARRSDDRVVAVLAARNKVFDIFFYRVVRFRRIYDFFDPFERALLDAVGLADRVSLERMLAQYPWREIRPLGSFRDPLEYALDKRRHATVKQEGFNDDFYRNATHQILMVEKRYTFADEQSATLVGRYQRELVGIFDDFVTLIEDPQQKREILLANAADRSAVYETKSRFEIENYLSLLMEFVIALVNDDFFEHGMQVLGIVKRIHADFGLDAKNIHWKRFKEQCAMISRAKLADYSASRTRAVLLRAVLPLFEGWTPEPLIETGLCDPDRRERKFALSLLEAYGRDVYEAVVDRLGRCTAKTSWYEVRNIAYILGRIVTGNEPLRRQAVTGLAPYLSLTAARQLNLQVVSALAFIGTEQAESILVSKLPQFGAHPKDHDHAEVAQRIASTLFGFGTPRAVGTALEYCLDRGLVAQYRDDLARVTLPPALAARVVGQVRKEVRRLKLTRSVFGNAASAATLLSALGHAGTPEVEELCREIRSALPPSHELAVEAGRLLETAPPPAPLASDRLLNAHLLKKDLPQAICHALDAETTGRLSVETRDGLSCTVDLFQGQVTGAAVPAYFVEGERAFYWIFLLEARDVASVAFEPGEKLAGAWSVKSATPDLLRDALFQRAESQRISKGAISPESRFARRRVHAIYTDFSRLDEPQKYEAVWKALAEETDLKTIRSATRLSRHDIFRVLLYFHGRDMLVVDGGRRDAKSATITDALATIELYLRRIREQPVHFRSYHAAANGCTYLQRHAVDDAVKEAARAMRAYLLDAYAHHRAFVEENVDVCQRTVELAAEYHATRAAADRQALVEYVAFSFAAVSATDSHAARLSRTLLEQIENIESGNDPYEPAAGGEDWLGDLVASIGPALEASGVSVEALEAGVEPTDAEAKVILAIFSNLACLHARPLKEFVRELTRARAAGESTSSNWLASVGPCSRLLARVADALQFKRLELLTTRVERAIASQQAASESEVPKGLCELMLAEHQRLAEMAPLAFALELGDAHLAARKEALFARLVLRQVDGVAERELNRLAVAGLTTLETILDMTPDDIAVAAGLEAGLADRIFLKFYQYRDLHAGRRRPEMEPRFAEMFDIGLNILKEIHAEVERIAADREAREADRRRRDGLVADRQRTLASLLALLALKERYDMIEALQLAPFEERMRLLDGYFAGIAHAAAAAGASPNAAA
jgi:hypothetical protein